MAGKVHAFLVGLGVFLMVVAGVLTIQLVSKASPPDRDIDAAPTSRTPSPTRAVGTGTPSPSATPTTPTTTILPVHDRSAHYCPSHHDIHTASSTDVDPGLVGRLQLRTWHGVEHRQRNLVRACCLRHHPTGEPLRRKWSVGPARTS